MTVSAAASGPAVTAGVLTAVAQACRDEERLRFGYTSRGHAPTEREVEPHRVVALGGRWYLVAYDLDRHDWRSFRLDRLTDPTATGARFRPRPLPAEDAVTFVQAASGAPAPYTVEAVVHAPSARVRQAVGQWGTIEPLDRDSCRLTMTSTSLDWPTQALGNVGAEFEVLGPPEFAVHVQEWGARFLRATRPPTSAPPGCRTRPPGREV
jgi:predicted DNA-binding transcriptional regulator YafY